MSKEVAPQMVMEFLNALFSKFDEICDDYDVYKVRDCLGVQGPKTGQKTVPNSNTNVAHFFRT